MAFRGLLTIPMIFISSSQGAGYSVAARLETSASAEMAPCGS